MTNIKDLGYMYKGLFTLAKDSLNLVTLVPSIIVIMATMTTTKRTFFIIFHFLQN